MTYSFELNGNEQNIVKDYAAKLNNNIAEIAKNKLLERIEDEMDLRLYEQAKAEYEADPVTYSHAEIGKILGIIP